MNLSVFFDFEPKNMFPGTNSMEFVWSGVGRALMQFMHFSAIFGMLVVLATPTLRGVSGDVVTLYGY